MGWDIQINPTAEAFPITHNLVELLDEWAVDFDIKYCALQRDPRLIAQLSTYRPANAAEAAVIGRLIRELEDEDCVELMLGH
jgi:hypothetical protein